MKRLVAVSMLFLSVSATAAERTRFVSHRGESMFYPENTMASFRAAVENGADGFELDTYLTKDDGLICLHDGTTKRTTGVELKPIDATIAELQALDAGSWKGEQFKGERLPTLAEALSLARDNFEIYVEIKAVPVAKLHKVAEAVKAEPKATPERVLFITFSAETVKEMRRLLPEYRAYWLTGSGPDKEGKPGPTAEEIIAKAKACNAPGVDVGDSVDITAEFVKAVKAAGLSMHVWTVNRAPRARELAAMGVETVTTDSGAMLKKAVYGGNKTADDFRPLIHWTFDGDAKNSGTGGARYDAAVQGTAEYVEGRLGKGLRLDGTGSGVAGAPCQLPLRGTIALWFKPEAFFNYNTVFDNEVNPDQWEMWISADGQLNFRPSAKLSCDLKALGGPGRWYHIAVTWDCMGEEPVKLYVDGAERAAANSGWVVPGSTFYIGGGNPGNNKGKGVMDDVRVYPAPLSGEQIQELFKAAK